ncbi:MAG: hypothetical protein J3K34DRAFT_520533 [Monoraphidium minutum]|nr:MAG: hypothetical protein J3K34DRAFT_520533 [Monoraphidium minutum]
MEPERSGSSYDDGYAAGSSGDGGARSATPQPLPLALDALLTTPRGPLMSFETVPLAPPPAPRKGRPPPGHFDLSSDAPVRRLSFGAADGGAPAAAAPVAGPAAAAPPAAPQPGQHEQAWGSPPRQHHQQQQWRHDAPADVHMADGEWPAHHVELPHHHHQPRHHQQQPQHQPLNHHLPPPSRPPAPHQQHQQQHHQPAFQWPQAPPRPADAPAGELPPFGSPARPQRPPPPQHTPSRTGLWQQQGAAGGMPFGSPPPQQQQAQQQGGVGALGGLASPLASRPKKAPSTPVRLFR